MLRLQRYKTLAKQENFRKACGGIISLVLGLSRSIITGKNYPKKQLFAQDGSSGSCY
jgi:hypothetical protein